MEVNNQGHKIVTILPSVDRGSQRFCHNLGFWRTSAKPWFHWILWSVASF